MAKPNAGYVMRDIQAVVFLVTMAHDCSVSTLYLNGVGMRCLEDV